MKKINFWALWLKIHVLKNIVPPLLSSKEKAVPIIFFGVREVVKKFGEMPEKTRSDVFLGAFNGFLAGEPHLGCRKVDFRFFSG